MYKLKNLGFTLIELLVVISVISLIASIAFASLGTARNKAADSAIKGNMSSVRPQAEIFYYSNNNVYSSYSALETSGVGPFACRNSPIATANGIFSDPNIIQMINAAMSFGQLPNFDQCALGIGGQSWSLSIPLRTGGWWCVSSSGGAGSGSAAVKVGGVNSGMAVCQ